MRLTRRERRAINSAVAAEIDATNAELGARLADVELQLARASLKVANLHVYTLQLERFHKESPNA